MNPTTTKRERDAVVVVPSARKRPKVEETKEAGCIQLPLMQAPVWFDSAFLTPSEARGLMAWCQQHLPFAQHQVKVFGKTHNQPRLTCLMGQGAYTYAGLKLEPQPMPHEFRLILDRLAQRFPGLRQPNTVLCNLYRDGRQYIGMHSDDEKDLDPDAPIYSVSLGATRTFRLHHKYNPLEKHQVALTSGSLLVMGPPTQRFYKHGIPQEKRIHHPRINLTFRCIKQK